MQKKNESCQLSAILKWSRGCYRWAGWQVHLSSACPLLIRIHVPVPVMLISPIILLAVLGVWLIYGPSRDVSCNLWLLSGFCHGKSGVVSFRLVGACECCCNRGKGKLWPQTCMICTCPQCRVCCTVFILHQYKGWIRRVTWRHNMYMASVQRMDS